MIRVLLVTIVLGLFGIALAGCHAEAGGGVGNGGSTTSVSPAQ